VSLSVESTVALAEPRLIKAQPADFVAVAKQAEREAQLEATTMVLTDATLPPAISTSTM